MNPAQFKKIVSLLREVYKQVREEAISAGIDIFSAQYDELIALAREKVLESQGFTVQQYKEAKARIGAYSQADIAEQIESIPDIVSENVAKFQKLSMEEISLKATEIAHAVAKEYIKPPQIINQIVKEITIQKPQIIKETTIEKTVQEIAYDEKPILQQLENLDKAIKAIVMPTPLDIEAIKSDLKLDFGKKLQHNIDTLGMPDFRKLAMGLQGQIDDITRSGVGHTIQDEGVSLTQRTVLNFTGAGVSAADSGGKTVVTISGGGAGSGYQAPTGTVDGSNAVFVFSTEPSAIVVDGVSMRKTASDTTVNWTGTTTITLSVAPNFDIYAVA